MSLLPSKDILKRESSHYLIIDMLGIVQTPKLPNSQTPKRLFKLLNLREVLVTVVEVLATHTPDKGVVVRGGGAVDAPFR